MLVDIELGIKSEITQPNSISFLTSLSPHTPNMKVAVIFFAIVACVAAQGTYTAKYDNIDVEQILKSDRLLNNYVNCLLDAGSCTPDGKELKKSLPDALATGCIKCSEKQKVGSEKVIRYLVNQRPLLWEKLAKKYDPKNEYKVKFQEEAKKAGITV